MSSALQALNPLNLFSTEVFQTGKSIITKLYYGGILIGIIYGMGTGTTVFFKWWENRKKVTIGDVPLVNKSMVDPILNVSRDAGYWGWYALTSGISSGFIIATYPVSVPLLSFISKEEGKNK